MSRGATSAPEGHGPARRTRIRALLVLLVIVVVVGGTTVALRPVIEGAPGGATVVVAGRVVDEQGAPVPGATVRGHDRTAVTDGQGGFRLTVPTGPLLLEAEAEGHLPRTQAAEPGVEAVLRLTGQAADTLSLRFGGDVMLGRRFYDRDEDGDRGDGLLPEGATVEQHAALLDHVEPLLADADLTVVNFEAAITPEAWVDPAGPRPAAFHPTKDFISASAPEAVPALAEAGVDVVSLGNNHVYDALEPGLVTTLAAFDAAGIPHFGAGRTVGEAWAPALVERKGQVVAFLGCTSVVGVQHDITYVADETHGGAARCTPERLDREVRAARARADVVAVLIHGGEEYVADQAQVVRDLTSVALRAGAAIAVNGHPHVVGGVDTDRDTVVAETMGNLLFDQTVWPTFLSYLLRVDVRAGLPVLTTVDPLLLEGYLPRPTVGLLADASARKAAGLPSGDMLLRDPGAVSTGAAPRSGGDATEALAAGSVARLEPGWWVAEPPGQSADVGEDLLWATGSFEDLDTDPRTAGAHMWELGPNVELAADAACSGSVGATLRRSPVSTEDVVASPRHRQLVTPGTRLSLLAEVRDASPGATLELRWYAGTSGSSSAARTVEIPEVSDADECVQVRLDAVVPDGIVAAQPYVRLAPPAGVHFGAQLAVDDVRLVAWGEEGAAGRRYDTVGATSDTAVRLADDRAGPRAGPRRPFADVSVSD